LKPQRFLSKTILPTALFMMILPTFVSVASAFLLGVVNGQVLRNITVDDNDPAIIYTGSWGLGSGDSDSYGDAHRWANQSGAYATFSFTGNSPSQLCSSIIS